MFFLRVGVALLGFGLASFYAFLLTIVRRDRSLVPRDYGRMMHRIMDPLLGLKVVVLGEENLRADLPCVYVVNHQSAFDVPVLARIFPERTVLIAKTELRSIPFFGWVYEATGNIYINRRDSQGSIQRLREAELAIRERNVSVWIFPEGTRGRTPGELLPFKKGAFHLAVAAGVPIVPIVVSPVARLFDVRNRKVRPGTAFIEILPPVPTDQLTEDDVNQLSREVREQMSQSLLRLAEMN